MADNKLKHNLLTDNKGFTIIELIIATAIFSGALLMLILGFLAMSKTYTRGLTVAETQNTARSVINTISQSIQFGDPATLNTNYMANSTTGPSGWLCADNSIFAYTLGQEVGNNSDAIMEFPTSSCPGSGSPAPGAGCAQITANCYTNYPGAKELLAPKMRLANFTIQNSDNTYTINLEIVYGDNSYLQPNIINGQPYYYDFANPIQCTGQAVINFCAVSNLNTVVEPRLAN